MVVRTLQVRETREKSLYSVRSLTLNQWRYLRMGDIRVKEGVKQF